MCRLKAMAIINLPSNMATLSLPPLSSLFPLKLSPSIHCTTTTTTTTTRTESNTHFSRRRFLSILHPKPGCSSSSRQCGSHRATPPTAGELFSFGTAAVLPFYSLMVVAPKSRLTRTCMKSRIPDVVLGLLYGYAVYLSWTPDTFQLLLGGNNGMPKLTGIIKMFSSEMRMTSGWIHLVVVDLFAAREVYKDGLENEIETRHSVLICLLACPLGIFTHFLTKALAATAKNRNNHPTKQ